MKQPLILRKQEERRLRAGHLWIFSNEVDVAQSPLAAYEPGDLAEVRDARGRALGLAYVNPRSLICGRLLSRNPSARIDRDWLTQRVARALALRERLFDRPYYRLVFGESDGLPGLVVDRYGAVAVAQITTAGMERRKDDVVAALQQTIAPAAIAFRNDTPMRELEGLPLYVEAIPPGSAESAVIEENGARFEVAPLTGQKTGWFYDHRYTRARLPAYVAGRRVLDMFSYTGAWGVQAAVAGAAQVLCVDESQRALEMLGANAALNGVEGRVQGQRGEAFAVLKSLREAGERFDVVILDPPAFIKRRRDREAGLQAYRRLNEAAMQLLPPDGILITASCSYHLDAADLRHVLLQASRRLGRTLQILEQGHQAPDHPVHPAIEETNYLKTVIACLRA